MKVTPSGLGTVLVMIAGWLSTCAQNALAAPPDLAYRPIPGVSPEPLPTRWPVTREELEAFMDGVMAVQLKLAPAPGATLAVVKDGEIFFTKGYGYADSEKKMPVDPQRTLFRAGSTSKLFAWTAVMQQVERGKLDLDTDVNDYLKAFKLPSTYREPITLRNLMTHSAGFEDGTLGYLLVKSQSKLEPLAQWLPNHMPARVRPPTTDFSSGVGAAYSNWGTALAGYIAAQASGLSFDEYVEQHIFAPLGMTRSTFREPLPVALAQDVARGHVSGNAGFEPMSFEFLHNEAPAGSLSSTATDMARFMLAYLQEGALGTERILEPQTVRLMHARALSPDPVLDGMALGFVENWINGRRVVGHGGDTLYFHSMLSLLPEAGVGLFVSFNAAEAGGAADQVLRAFMDQYFPARLPEIAAQQERAAENEQYAGKYRSLRRSYTKIDKLIAASRGFSVEAEPDGTLYFAHPFASFFYDGPGRWVAVRPGVFRHATEPAFVVFEQGKDGRTYAVGPEITEPFERIRWYEAASFHLQLMGLAIVFFVSAIVRTARQRRRDRDGPVRLRWAWPTLALAALLLIGFLLVFVVAVSAGTEELVLDFPSTKLLIALAMPLAAIPLAAAAIIFVVIAWMQRAWSLGTRLHYTAATLGAVALLWVLGYWNLLGYRFG